MPGMVVRKRLARRPGDWKQRVNRWYYRNRPKIAVVAAFGVACAMSLVAASLGLTGLGAAPTQPGAATATAH